MQFIVMVYECTESLAARNDPKLRTSYRTDTMYYLQALKDAGVLICSAALHAPANAFTLRYWDGMPQLRTGPAYSSSEELGLVIHIDAGDINEALEWAARFPHHSGVTVELRPAHTS